MSRRDAPFSKTVDHDTVKMINDRVVRNSDVVDEMVTQLVADYCADLDAYMLQIRQTLDSGLPITDEQLDTFTLHLPNLLYFTGEAQESLGIREDVAKAIKQDLYNVVREKAQGTVADKDTAADLATTQEAIVHSVYQRAYKKVKLRMDAGYEMLASVKKVMSRRISEYELGRVDPGTVQGGARREQPRHNSERY